MVYDDHNISKTHKYFKMKKHKILMIFFLPLWLASACKKESDTIIQNADSASQLKAQSTSRQEFSAANFLFVPDINNPYFPLLPGTKFTYRNTITDKDGTTIEHEIMTVTSDIKKIIGVNCEVVHDQVKEDGEVTEDTYDWYAQDKFGNVWYFGEDTKELTDTGWSTEGSWEAGKHGASPGIIMFARPDLFLGLTYYEEFQRGDAEDQATLLNTDSKAKVPYGSFTNCLETKNFTRLDPTDIEYKFYAKGVGQVLGTSATERDELISIKH